MKEHEKNMLSLRGMLNEPDSTFEVNEAIRWYYNTLRYRRIDSDSGICINFTPMEIRELYDVEPTFLHLDYIYYVATALDNEYINFRYRQRLEQSNK